jgi:hypothetical protein
MPAVANAIAADLAQIDPAHASYYKANAASFTGSLSAWTKAIAGFRSAHPDTPVATTEPVADYMLQAAGTDNLTPWTFQADIMNGNDPSPQNTALQDSLVDCARSGCSCTTSRSRRKNSDDQASQAGAPAARRDRRPARWGRHVQAASAPRAPLDVAPRAHARGQGHADLRGNCRPMHGALTGTSLPQSASPRPLP